MLGFAISPDASAVIAQCVNVLIVLILVVGHWVDKAKKYFHKTPQEAYAQNARVHALCARAGEELTAIRVYVSQYKNGHSYFSGDPDDRKDRTIEWVRPYSGIKPVADEYNDVLVSTVFAEMTLVLTQGSSFTRVADLPEGAFKYYCVRDGSVAIARVGIHQMVEGKMQLVALLGADFDTDTEPKNMDALNKYAGLVSLEINPYRRKSNA